MKADVGDTLSSANFNNASAGDVGEILSGLGVSYNGTLTAASGSGYYTDRSGDKYSVRAFQSDGATAATSVDDLASAFVVVWDAVSA